jgi:hypothetical protein
MARTLNPPAALDLDAGTPSVFLAGSIEMGLAEDWQNSVTQSFQDLDIVLLNPRREEWDASWQQSIEEPRFREQVEWELEAQEQATLIAMHFVPSTLAPVTLLELGLAARSGKLIVSCPDGFWRKGNVEVVCARYGVPLVSSLQELIGHIRRRLSARR